MEQHRSHPLEVRPDMAPIDPVGDIEQGRAPVVARRQTVTAAAPAPPRPPEPIVVTRVAGGSPKDVIYRRLRAFEQAARATDGEVDVAELADIVRAVVDLL